MQWSTDVHQCTPHRVRVSCTRQPNLQIKPSTRVNALHCTLDGLEGRKYKETSVAPLGYCDDIRLPVAAIRNPRSLSQVSLKYIWRLFFFFFFFFMGSEPASWRRDGIREKRERFLVVVVVDVHLVKEDEDDGVHDGNPEPTFAGRVELSQRLATTSI